MKRTAIVARMRPGSHAEVARIFGESDATSLPRDLGVRQRSLFALDDLYLHLIDFAGDADRAMSELRYHHGFHEISERLSRYISPYRADWRSPRDAVADCFYQWPATD